jgi:putative cell wall-binding protein
MEHMVHRSALAVAATLVTLGLTISASPAAVAAQTGGPAHIAAVIPMTRLSGADRIATAVAISQNLFAAGTAGAVVLARSDGFADALAGTPLAAGFMAPILLTPPTTLDARASAEMQRVLGAPGKTVYLLGGTSALSAGIETAIQALGYATVRFAGADRFATAADIAGSTQLGSPSTVLVTTGDDFPDSLCAGAATAGAGPSAILLTDGSTVPAPTAAYLAGHPGDTVYAIGGQAAAAGIAGAVPIVGVDRYDTCVKVAQKFFPNPTGVTVASGEVFPDGLAGGAHAANAANGFPLLLVAPDAVPSSVLSWLTANKATLTRGYVYGGPSTISDATVSALQAALS